jgi:dipeptidyl-peptidase 4
MSLFPPKFVQLASFILLATLTLPAKAQLESKLWSRDGNVYYQIKNNEIVAKTLPGGQENVLVPEAKLMEPGGLGPVHIQSFSFSTDFTQVLIFANTQRVWRYNTRGDYFIYSVATGRLAKLGKSLPASSLMFAKISPDQTKVA